VTRREALALAALPLLAYLVAPFESEGPHEVAFAVHRLDVALMGTLVAVLAVSVERRRRRQRRTLSQMLARGIGIRVGLMALGLVMLAMGAALGSRDYWDYSGLTLGFHLLGPARMMAEGSLLLSGLGLPCSAEVVRHLLETSPLGATAAIYFQAALDALILGLLGMAGERGLPPFQVFQVVSRISVTTALFSIPLAIYGGKVGYWGAEPFAWIFSLLALALLVPAARKER
jgi:hypothetical protein